VYLIINFNLGQLDHLLQASSILKSENISKPNKTCNIASTWMTGYPVKGTSPVTGD